MTYLRFLTDKDYNSIATDEHIKQLIRDVPERISQAEQRAEMNMLEYLDQYYEIEKVLAVGKNIREYDVNVSYPGNVWIKHEGTIYKTLTRINGHKKPVSRVYWTQVTDYIAPMLMDRAIKYSQLRMYAKGDVVRFGTEYWRCEIPHGYEAGEIHMPGVNVWLKAESADWEPNMEWEKDQVCKYQESFYQYLEKEGESGEEGSGSEGDQVDLAPDENPLWGLIGEYSEGLEYKWGDDMEKDYVVCDGDVYYAAMNPNADALANGVNITPDDPRNINIVSHMSRIALYYLHQIISPTNISETRRWAFEDSMAWLSAASRFKINPQLPRKKEHDGTDNKVDWACSTFQKDYNPNENAWLI